MVHPTPTTDMAKLAAQKHRRSPGLDDVTLGGLRSALRCIRHCAELQHTGQGAAAGLHRFVARGMVTDTGIRERVVNMESDVRGGWFDCFAGRD